MDARADETKQGGMEYWRDRGLGVGGGTDGKKKSGKMILKTEGCRVRLEKREGEQELLGVVIVVNAPRWTLKLLAF